MATAPQSVPARPSSRLYRHLGGWTVWLVCFLILTVLTFQFVNDWLNKDLDTLTGKRAGVIVPDSDVALNHQRLMLFGRGAAGILGITVILWLCWQFQAHSNLRALARSRPRFGPVTGLLAWVVPVIDLALVPMAFGELWLKSDLFEGTPDRTPRWWVLLVLLWWGFFVSAAALAGAAFGHASSGSLSGLIARDALLKNAFFLAIGAAAAGSLMVVLIHLRLDVKETRIET
jgi:hypothetical protein